MKITVPKLSLVLLVGPSGSGKSTFAAKHFLTTEVLSSDVCRGLVSDDNNSQTVTDDAFDVLNFIAQKRLRLGKLTVVDATNVQPESRKKLIQLAREFHVLPVAIVLNLPEKVCQERNRQRSDRNFGPHVIRQQRSQLRRSLRGLRREGFRQVYIFESQEQVESAVLQRVPLWNDKQDEHGPFDFIGDVHSCCDELESLLQKLNYEKYSVDARAGWSGLCYRHPENRKAVFVGDLIDRGPRAVDTLSLVKNMVGSGHALCVPGNHDAKLLRKLRGKDVKIRYGLEETLADIAEIPDEHQQTFKSELIEFLDGLVSHFVLDGGKVVVAHAGLREEMQGRGSGKVRSFALYGETTGETDEFGLPVRHNWAADYRGNAMVVYGHTPIPEPEWLNRTINIDTGCVFGGKLTALRYPEQELVSVPANQVYCEPVKPLTHSSSSILSQQQLADDVLDAGEVIGKQIIATRLRNNISIREENSVAALEVMSRFAVNPKWLIYLPPTMSPSETSEEVQFLEHPRQAFRYFENQNVQTAICEEKHMGSRAVVVVCREPKVAVERFGIETEEIGVIYTRTGRRFFNDLSHEQQLLERISKAMDACQFWEGLETDWACLDCELMPWSAKAQELLRTQYAAVGSAGRLAVPKVLHQLELASSRLNEKELAKLNPLIERNSVSEKNIERFANAYRQYCWDVNSLDDFKLAPFHILATEGNVHVNKDHAWHIDQIAKIVAEDEKVLRLTRTLEITLADKDSIQAGVDWWLQLTESGGEGMVVKPIDFIHRGPKGISQPAIKCRGKEYLRIIYGPDYDTPKNLTRLKKRFLNRKRSLAIREFALGIEALERFVAGQPLRKIHQCVFGVLALESEPVDPRL